MKLNITTLGLFFLINTIAFSENINENVASSFDISHDNKKLVIEIIEEKSSHLYEYSFENNKKIQLTFIENEYHSKPIYSPKDDKIIFLSKTSKEEFNKICILDKRTKKISKLTNGESNIQEMILDHIGNTIIFSVASDSFSLFQGGTKQPSNFDIFSIKIDGSGLQRLTYLKATSLYNLSLNQTSDSILCNIKHRNLIGTYLIPMNDSTTSSNNLHKIEAKNNPNPNIGDLAYQKVMYTPDFKGILFLCNQRFYILSLRNYECKEVYSDFSNSDRRLGPFPMETHFFQDTDKIIISTIEIKTNSILTNKFVLVDFKSKQKKEIEIN